MFSEGECNGSSDSTQFIHQCDPNFNDSQMYISAVIFPLVFMFSVRRQMSPVSARRVAFVFRDFLIGFITIISNDFTLSHYVRWMHNEILCLLHFCRPGFLTIHILPWSSMGLRGLRICRSQRLNMGLKKEEGQLGSEISGAVSGVTTPGESRLQASQLQERSAPMQRLHSRRAPIVAMCPPCLGGLGAVGGAVPPLLVQALGRSAGSLGRMLVVCGPPDSGLAADPGRAGADELDAPSIARRGSA